jgi:hypothetical protein
MEPESAYLLDWTKEAVNICDGGPINFGAEYDLHSHTFSHIAFNGAA